MADRKNILAIIGSAGENSANLKLVEKIKDLTADDFCLTIFNELKSLPHFDPQLAADKPPREVIAFRDKIERSDAFLICTPEYVFSIPAGLKNAIEWCIATTVFTNKPCGLITAAANGQKGHEQLQLIMKVAMARFTPQTTLLLQGIKGKFDDQDQLTDPETGKKLQDFIAAFKTLVYAGKP